MVALRRRSERGHEASPLQLLGEIAAGTDPPSVDQAEIYYRRALALADELGMRPLLAHYHLGHGTLCQKLGRDKQAQVELEIAAQMYGAMGMTHLWLARAKGEQAEILLICARTGGYATVRPGRGTQGLPSIYLEAGRRCWCPPRPTGHESCSCSSPC